MKKEVIGACELYLGNCRDAIPHIGRVDAVLTDPPYGIGIAANPFRQKHETKDWDNSVPDIELLDELREISTSQIIWGGNYFALPVSQGFFVWDKVQPEDFSSAMCEQAWTNIRTPAKLFRRHVVSYTKNHPTQKPLELMRWCINQLPYDARLILDPFMGVGTTGVACVKAGKRFIGVEIDPDYFRIACKLISAAYEQPDLFVSQPEPKPQQLSLMEPAE